MDLSFLYPKPRNLPPVVSLTTEQLLARLQSVLETSAPLVASRLQPGLSDAQIAALEVQGGFRLSDDLRALYRWHNGTSITEDEWLEGVEDELLGGKRFLSLDEAVDARALRQNVTFQSELQREAHLALVGPKMGWIQVLDDGAGDGYFYDPERTDAEGAFFYHFTDDCSYRWFPSLRNFLAGVVECYETGAIRVAADGEYLDEDFDRTHRIWERFARNSYIDD